VGHEEAASGETGEARFGHGAREPCGDARIERVATGP
jgi:hypothetical protein